MRALTFDKSLSFEPRRLEPDLRRGIRCFGFGRPGSVQLTLKSSAVIIGFRGVLGHEFVAEVISSPTRNWLDGGWWGRSTSSAGGATFASRG